MSERASYILHSIRRNVGHADWDEDAVLEILEPLVATEAVAESLRSQLSECQSLLVEQQQLVREATEVLHEREKQLADAVNDLAFQKRMDEWLCEHGKELLSHMEDMKAYIVRVGKKNHVTRLVQALTRAESAEQQLSECQRELEEVRDCFKHESAMYSAAQQQLQQMKEALEQLTIIAELLKDSPDDTVVSMGTWEEQTFEVCCQVFTLPKFHAKIKFDLKWLRAARALLSGKG